MHLLFRTYAHSKRASVVSIIGLILSVLMFAGAACVLIYALRLEVWPLFAAAVICIALSILCYRGSRYAADYLAVRDLEKKLGKPILGGHGWM